ncbi:MAG: LEA type 2 family protein [Deltaproteobacteria bacterium]|nr:LEA type 2 family protein [Deltaproteobacteria bacterium]
MKTITYLLLSFILASCSAVKPVTLDVALVDLYFSDVKLLETTLVSTIRIDNETPNSITFDGGVHKIYINDLYVGKALDDQTIEVPRLSSTKQQIKIEISNLTFFTKLQRMIQSKDFRYRIDSTFFVDGTYGIRKVTASKEGRFSLTPGQNFASSL